MIAGIVITFIVALGCLLLCVAFFLTDRQDKSRDIADFSVAGLSGVPLTDLDILFGREDYQKLQTRPELKVVRSRFWRDRRRIVLTWLSELNRDVQTVWEFRRFLVRNGLRVTFQEEVTILFAASVAKLYLTILRAAVFMFGPFGITGFLRRGRTPVVHLTAIGSNLLGRVPLDSRTGIEQRWNKQVTSAARAAG